MARDEAYREAEQRIEEALRSKAKVLNLSRMELTELPESLSQLTRLQTLILPNNRLTALPEWLGQLTQLQSLNLSYNRLTAFPESLGQLIQLQSLNLSDNQLTALPKSLGQFTQLQELYLYSNKLTILPKSISNLTALESLSLSANPLQFLPHNIGELRILRSLTLAETEVQSLPESVTELANLEYLALGHTPLTHLPEWIGKLIALKGLDLVNIGRVVCTWEANHTSIKRIKVFKQSKNHGGYADLPESLTQLPNLRQLFLHGNDRLDLPLEILGPDWIGLVGEKQAANPRAILAFYFGQQKRSAKPLNEVKLLLVGHGRVGKTSLSKSLRGVDHNDGEPETPGIERYPLSLAAGRSTITAHVWDFGGQEFLHQTHQFFFSERSIYLVVLSGRQGRPMQEAEYWLRLIRTYGTGSPVVIALNQIKAHPFTVDEHFLQENYPEVKAVMRTDCSPQFGIAPLRKLLGKLAGGMPSVREKIDPAWANVRKQLEEMDDSFVRFDRYREICAKQGVKGDEEQETLATILDCLGIALNYRDDPRLRDTSVLKPRWLVDGIYTILRWLHKNETNGELRLDDFPKALKNKKTYPPNMHEFLLALMEKFELCFPVDGGKDVYLVPGLLDANQPFELKKFTSGKAQKIQFRYEDVRPPGLLPRFIVRSHTLSERQPRWLRGVVLARGKAKALVRGDHEGRVTDVFVLGDQAEDRVWLSEFILSEMRALNDKLPVRTFVATEAEPGAWTELELLREAAQRHEAERAERRVDGRTVMIPVQETLREVESPEASAPKDNPLSLFICYANVNERTVKQLIPSLKVLARRGYITPWRDTDLIGGEDWDETIMERLASAQIILFMVSRPFLASEYITEKERPLAMKLVQEKKAIVVPVLLSACTWEEEDFAKLVNLPLKDKPISSFNPRDDGWKLVEEGLKKAVEQGRGFSKFSSPKLRFPAEDRTS